MSRNRSSHVFSQVPQAEIPRSSFDRSHGVKTTLDAGFLVPFFLDEALPGDTFKVRLTAFCRMATPIFPVMDNLYMDTFFFAVPYRLVWSNWQRFNGEQDNPGDSTDLLIPEITAPAGGYTEQSISDYFGIPTGVAGLKHSALWHRAYNLIWNQWFRDQNLQNSLTVPTNNGPDDPALYTLQKRGKRHDYFTSSLPWPQKGPGVALPLGTSAPVVPTGNAEPSFWVDLNPVNLGSAGGGTNATVWTTGIATTGVAQWNETKLVADLSSAASATINSLRQAFQIQKIYERDARGGTRYTELIKAHFGVTSPDARLQRPEYLGGGSTMVNIHPVAQTAPTGAYASTPQGNLAAFGTAMIKGHGFSMSFTEHCLILGLVSVRGDLTYQQGLNRMFSRRTRFDHYWPALAHIGEQAVLSKEIFADGTANDDLVWGYQERFAEYRYKPSMVTGKFRSQSVASLDAWHLAQEFATRPTLGASFIEENPPMDRVLAVPTEPDFLFDGLLNMRCARPMPLYGVPGLIDHF